MQACLLFEAVCCLSQERWVAGRTGLLTLEALRIGAAIFIWSLICLLPSLDEVWVRSLVSPGKMCRWAGDGEACEGSVVPGFLTLGRLEVSTLSTGEPLRERREGGAHRAGV